jgi:hypothetical protein
MIGLPAPPLLRSQQVFGEPFQHLLPQHELIHDES